MTVRQDRGLRIHCLMHVPFEDAANIGVWAAARGHQMRQIRLYEGELPPAADEVDMLAIMGGPMDVYEYDRYTWLRSEKRFIETVVSRGRIVVGVCLGAQLLADVLGGRVRANRHKEIGWHEVELTAAGRDCPVCAKLPPRFTAFHWHGDTFDIPRGAVHLARSDACENQAFIWGERALGLQCHLEYSQQSVYRMLEHCGHELMPAAFIQPRDDIIAGLAHVTRTQRLLDDVLDALAAQR